MNLGQQTVPLTVRGSRAPMNPVEEAWLATQPAETRAFVLAMIDNRPMLELQLAIAGYAATMEQQWSETEDRHVGLMHRLDEWSNERTTRARRRELEAFWAAERRLDRDLQLYGHTQLLRQMQAWMDNVRVELAAMYKKACAQESDGANRDRRREGKQKRIQAMHAYEQRVMNLDRQLNFHSFLQSLSADARPEMRNTAVSLRKQLNDCTTVEARVATIDLFTRQYAIGTRQ